MIVAVLPLAGLMVRAPATSSLVAGVEVPIPTRPFAESTTKVLPFTASAPAMVDVAVVDVALKYPNVGADVATTLPEESVERIELTATEESVSEGVVIEDVAVKVLASTSPPVKTPDPPTDSVRYGEVVPTPTLPALFTSNFVLPFICN